MAVLRKNLVTALAAIGVLVVWSLLMFLEIWDVLLADPGEVVERSGLRVAVLTMLTGMLGAALGLLASVSSSWDRLSALRPLFGVSADRIATAVYLVYGVLFVLGIVIGIVVAVTNEAESSTLLIAAASGGAGTIATGVAAWVGITWAPQAAGSDQADGAGNGPDAPGGATTTSTTPSRLTTLPQQGPASG